MANKYTDFYIKIKTISTSWFIPKLVDINKPTSQLSVSDLNHYFQTQLNYSANLKCQKSLSHFWQPIFRLIAKYSTYI